MQAGDAGGFFQHAAALLGLGLDDLADAALMHERRRARAGRGVGKQDLHVAGAHLAAVDAVGRAGLALDAAGDFERVLVVEGGGRRARRNCRSRSPLRRCCAPAALLEPEKITSSIDEARMDL